MITQYEFSLIHRFLMQNSMISHYFGIFEAMYHWEENDSKAHNKLDIGVGVGAKRFGWCNSGINYGFCRENEN